MKTLTTQIISSLILVVTTTTSSFANTGGIPNVNGTYRASDGGEISIVQNRNQLRVNFSIDSHTVTMQAEYLTWTVGQPNGVIVEQSGFIGPFETRLADGSRFSGTAHILPTSRRGVLEIQSTHTRNGQTFSSEPSRFTKVPTSSPPNPDVVPNRPAPVVGTTNATRPANSTEAAAEALLQSFGL